MIVVYAAPAPLKSHPWTPGVGSPNGSSALAVTACFMAAPTSLSVTSMQAAGLGNELLSSATGMGVGTAATGVGADAGVGGGSLARGIESSPGVPHAAFRNMIELANKSTPFFTLAS